MWMIKKIHCWLEDRKAPNILWLSGSPGVGKSTIASTLESDLRGSGRLCSYFFFKRGDVALSDPANLWRTVAFDLAQRNAPIADKVIKNLEEGKVDPTRQDIRSHFTWLIEDPIAAWWKRYEMTQTEWMEWLAGQESYPQAQERHKQAQERYPQAHERYRQAHERYKQAHERYKRAQKETQKVHVEGQAIAKDTFDEAEEEYDMEKRVWDRINKDPRDLVDAIEKLSIRGTVVILDALDECGSDNSQSTQRRIFMDTITRWSTFPPPFKLIVTSRDQDITPAFRNQCHHIALETGDLVNAEANLDIQRFFEQRFADIASSYCPTLPSWPGEAIIKRLTERAAGLFIWAETVIRFVEQGFPKDQLDLILNGAFREEGDAIDELYRQILQVAFGNSKGRVMDAFKRVVGAIVLAKTPLARNDLNNFLGRQDDQSLIDFILARLSSVISIRNPNGRIHVCHLSFTEFVCDPNRFHDFVIDRRIMALACFRIMKESLRFNICRIETSYVRNSDLNLDQRIKENIPTYLSYACLFWADHLDALTFDADLFHHVKEFMCNRLLYWLEVLSLIKELQTASLALTLIDNWSKVSCFIAYSDLRALI
jgi:hypothetical protein